jgi:hypothetical protein
MSEPTDEIKSQVAVIFGTNTLDDPKSFCKIKSQTDLIDSCVEVMFMVPPFRNFTIKVFLSILKSIQPDFKISDQ